MHQRLGSSEVPSAKADATKRVSGMWRRLPTTLALAGLFMVAALYVALWTIALSQGDVRAIKQHYEVPARLRGNHGPWRHHRVLRDLSEYALMILFIGALPLAALGILVERTRRAGIVGAFALTMLVVDCAHFPLFD